MLGDDVELDRVPGLSTRARNVLVNNNGLRTVGEVRRISDKEMLKWDNFGMVSLREVRELLASDAEPMPAVQSDYVPCCGGEYEDARLSVMNSSESVLFGTLNIGDNTVVASLTPAQARVLASALNGAAAAVEAGAVEDTFEVVLGSVEVSIG